MYASSVDMAAAVTRTDEAVAHAARGCCTLLLRLLLDLLWLLHVRLRLLRVLLRLLRVLLRLLCVLLWLLRILLWLLRILLWLSSIYGDGHGDSRLRDRVAINGALPSRVH